GGSCIVDPFGNFLVEPHCDGETILMADLDMNEIVRGKYDFDVTGHYSRPDVFQLHVNERVASPVTVTGDTPSPGLKDDPEAAEKQQ
ncbi:MAG: hypothetical protein V2I35_06790, partial [Desulfocapsaceae bacterium]|nr:hypothetical protein [Desulfocapsaceae bacterium]